MPTAARSDLSLYVANLDCESDAARVKRSLEGMPGVLDLVVYPKSARVAITLDPQTTSEASLRQKLKDNGFPPREMRGSHGPPSLLRNPKVLSSVASGILLLVGWIAGISGAPSFVTTGCYLVSLLAGGYYFGHEAIEDLLFERKAGIELLMSTAAVAATLLGAAGEGAMLAFLYSISEAAEGYTEAKTRSSVAKLMDLAPKTALVRRGTEERQIPVEQVDAGDVFVVKPGESIATDGEVIEGQSSVNQAPVTGESISVEKATGAVVFAGSINGEGSLVVRATKRFAENTISRIIQMVEEAQERKGKSQRFIERFGERYTPAVLAVGILLAIIPPLVFHAQWHDWLARATVFIVAAAPCALVISIPITLVAALGTAARKGILIKGGVYVEELAKVQVVALDKTGTITRGVPEVVAVVVNETHSGENGPTRESVLALASGLERRSQHPLARAIIQYAERNGVSPADVRDFRSVTGAGVTGRVENATVSVASPAHFLNRAARSLDWAHGEIERLQSEGSTVIVVANEQEALGVIAIRDTVRDNAADAIAALREQGVQKVVMLTGDNARTAAAIAKMVGVDEVFADLKPEDKAVRVRELTVRDGHVAMVGDGVNDAPALAEATVGIAMGAAGTDVALETADVALMADDLEKLVDALALAKRNQQLIRQNVWLSIVVVGTLIVGAITNLFSLPVAVVAHELSEFVVIANGLRMLRA